MNCIVCHRELKRPNELRMGKTCAKRAARAAAIAEAKKIRVELISRPSERARRAYLVFTSPRVRVVIATDETLCDCGRAGCEHLHLANEKDSILFPPE